MLRWFSIVTLGLAGLVLALAVKAGPILQVTPEVYDFGRKPTNEGLYEFKFVLKNAGDALLKLEKIRSGCGCTEVKADKQELAPGEETELKGQFKTTTFEGRISKAIFIQSNDEKSKSRVLTIKMILPFSEPGLRFYPKTTRFFAQQRGTGISAFFGVENCDPAGAAKILKVDLPKGWRCETVLPVTIAAENRANLTFNGPAPGEGEEFRDLPFTIYTDHKDNKEMKGTLSFLRPVRRAPPVRVPAKPLEAAKPEANAALPAKPAAESATALPAAPPPPPPSAAATAPVGTSP